MQKKTKLWIAGGTAGLLALGGIAGLADAGMGGGMGGGMDHGMGHGMMARQMMERYDANKDGKLTQDEIDQNRMAWHAEFDADKNATLSLDEFKNLWAKARNEQMVREFQRFDRDGNGQVTLDEYQKPLAGLVAMRDRNGDGALSREDRRERGERGRHRGPDQGQGMMDDDAGEGQPPLQPAPANP